MHIILSSDPDYSSIKVFDWLKYYQKEVQILTNNTKIQSIKLQLNNSQSNFVIIIGEKKIEFSSIESFWFRRGQFNFQLDISDIDNQIVNYIKMDLNSINGFIYYLLSTKTSLGSEDKGNLNKLICLDRAKKNNLLIPETFVIDSKNEVGLLLKKYNSLITKGIS